MLGRYLYLTGLAVFIIFFAVLATISYHSATANMRYSMNVLITESK